MKILVIAPHPDDEVLGCGGTIAKYVDQGHEVYICIVTKGMEPLFPDEQVTQVRGECVKADKLLGVKETIFLDFPAAMIESVPRYKLNDSIAAVIRNIAPDEVYIPHRGDMQLDHAMIADACMVALRPRGDHPVSRIYAYETLSETGWNIPGPANDFVPTVYNDISGYLDRKIEAMNVFESQLADYPAARSIDAIRALAMYRGSTVNCMFAECFSLIREIRHQ